MRRAFALYERGLRERPVLTNSVVAATLMGSGDAIQQLFFERRAKHAAGQSADYNLRRSLSMAAFGLFPMGVTFTRWFGFLQRRWPDPSLRHLLTKVALDQGLMAPAFTVVFLSSMSAMNGRSAAEVRDTVREGFVPTLESNYKIWPAAQLVNFYLVPLRFRVVFSNAVGLVFNVILSGIYSSASSSSSPAASSVSAPSPPALPPASRKD